MRDSEFDARETGKMNTENFSNSKFDAVVILGGMNVNDEMNKVASSVVELTEYPGVVVIQPDCETDRYYIEKTENEKINVLHVLRDYTEKQGKIIEQALLSLKVIRYQLWVYNFHFSYFLQKKSYLHRIMYLTQEDISFDNRKDQSLEREIRNCLAHVDLVAIEPGVDLERLKEIVCDRCKIISSDNISNLAKSAYELPEKIQPQKTINVLYDENALHVFTIKNYLSMFERYSHHKVVYTPATMWRRCKRHELEHFDAIIIFYSIRVCIEGHLAPTFERALRNYKGHKILMLQDDYEYTERTRRMIEYLNINTVYTVVPKKYIQVVYPSKRFPQVNFFSILTSYISEEIASWTNPPRICDRTVVIGYRGRNIGYWYGDLMQEKAEIGVKMKQICKDRGIKEDIEWEEDKRIYYEKWLNWLTSCKAMLGTESGSNVFDDEGKLKKKIKQELRKNPHITYQEVHDKYLKHYEGIIKMNQISPKIFEAISTKTALILFEGNYSGVLEENTHYIPLKKDFSNIEDVIEKVQNDEYLQQMVDFTYDDITRRYDLRFSWLIQYIDACIDADYLLIGSDKKSGFGDIGLTILKRFGVLTRLLKCFIKKLLPDKLVELVVRNL